MGQIGGSCPRTRAAGEGAKQPHRKFKEHKRQFDQRAKSSLPQQQLLLFGCQLVYALVVALHSILLFSPCPFPKNRGGGLTETILCASTHDFLTIFRGHVYCFYPWAPRTLVTTLTRTTWYSAKVFRMFVPFRTISSRWFQFNWEANCRDTLRCSVSSGNYSSKINVTSRRTGSLN